ncbi:MAG: protein kinase [Acidobacteria bacterium]|nr:protein kinase [Acidobacteriota bacterium]
MPLPPNTRLGRYEIRSLLGAGGMGEVYLAEDTELERQVALKILLAEVAMDEDRVRRFVQEAKAASALNHPNILTVYEIGSFENSRFIATELIKGETLRARLQGEPLTLRETLDVAVQIASALNAAHAAGIVHRDIKPENVMLRDDGLAKVLDFGLAKLTDKKVGSLDSEGETRALGVKTSPGMVMGTVTYMSPEQARGKEIDARSDIWSLGVVDLLLDLKNLKRELDFAEEIERSAIPPFARAANVGTNQSAENATAILPAAISTPNSLPQPTSSAEYIVGEIKRHKRGVALGSIILLALIGVGSWFIFNRAAGHKQIESIAVMPFVNESGNADVEYLSDGMTETLINSLSQLPNLSVKARSSVFRYKGKEIDPKKIASELNVQAILTGRVVQRGEQLRLSLELIDAQTENVIWSEQYNRRQADLVSLQGEIARDVSSKLKTKLSGTDEQKVTKNYTTNPEAYQLYLKGRFQWNKRTGESLKQAVEFYKQAVEKDPNFALAYSGLAKTYALFPVFSVALPKDSMPQAKAAALRALALDDSLDEAHAALGLYLSAFAWNQPAAETELRRAIELNPNNATAYQWLGILLAFTMGRFDEGIAAGRRAEELDPLSPVISADSGFCLFGARRYDEAIAQLKRALTLDPNFYYTRFNLGTVYHAKGMYSEAIVEYRKARELDDDPFVTALLARSLAKSGGRGEATKLRDQLRAESARRYVPNIAFALVYAALDDKDEAFKWMEKDFAERSFYPSFYAVYPLLDDLRDDPRFADLVRRVESAKMD